MEMREGGREERAQETITIICLVLHIKHNKMISSNNHSMRCGADRQKEKIWRHFTTDKSSLRRDEIITSFTFHTPRKTVPTLLHFLLSLLFKFKQVI